MVFQPFLGFEGLSTTAETPMLSELDDAWLLSILMPGPASVPPAHLEHIRRCGANAFLLHTPLSHRRRPSGSSPTPCGRCARPRRS